MKHNKQELLALLGASSIATVFYEIISDYTPLQVSHLVLGEYGRIGNWIAIGVFALVLFLLSSIAPYFWLKHQGFRAAFMNMLLGACLGAFVWVAIGFLAFRYIPFDRTISLFASFFIGLLLAKPIYGHFIKNLSRSKTL